MTSLVAVLGTATPAHADWYTGSAGTYGFKKQLTIDNTKVGGATHTDFPVLVSFTDTDLRTTSNGGRVTNSSGYDIIFTDSDGSTKLDHEIERYVASTGQIVMWVRVPAMSHLSNTILYLYFGNSTISTSQENANGVWDTNFKGVWHMKEDPSGSAPQIKDSTSSAQHATSYGSMNSGNQVTGKANGGMSFDGSNDYVDAGNVSTLVNTSAFTISAWMKRSGANGEGYVVKSTDSFTDIVGLELGDDGNIWFHVGPTGSNAFGSYASNDTNWHLVTLRYDGSLSGNANRLRGYVDGTQQTLSFTGTVPSTSTTNTSNFRFARQASTYTNLSVDEIRVSNTARSAAWITAEYNNQNNPATFMSVGPLITQASEVEGSSDGLITYLAGTATPQVRKYTSSADSFTSASGSVAGATGVSIQTRTSPNKNEAVSGYVTSSGQLYVTCFDGTSWTNEFNVAVGGTGTTRRFDVAYETNSGDVVVLYSRNVGTTNEMGYRTKSGAAGCGAKNWSDEIFVNPVRTSGTVQWIRMAWDKRASSNQMTAIWADSASDLSAMTWDGNVWGNEPSAAIETSLEVVSGAQDTQSFDVEYETNSGEVFVAWGNSGGTDGTNGTRYKTCTGGTASCTWNANVSPGGTGDDATQVDLGASPTSDAIVFASVGNAGNDLQAGYWSGSAYTHVANLDTSAQTVVAGRMTVAVGWTVSGGTSRSVIAYNDSGETGISWAVGNAASIAVQSDASGISPTFANPQAWYAIETHPRNNSELMLTVSDNSNDLFAKRLTMTSTPAFTWSNVDGSALETSLAAAQPSPSSFAYWRHAQLTQNVNRWYAANNGVQPSGSGLADENIPYYTSSSPTDVRLRMNATLGAGSLAASKQRFALQYATSSAGPWTNVRGASWWNASWLSRKKITIDNTASSENLANFPLRVSFSAANIDYTKTQNAGEDIRFVDADGTTLLSHEIETWNESGTSEVHVKVPQIDANSNTDFIWVYYNNAGASDGQSVTGVWDTKFKGVWHLKEDPSVAGNGGTKDSTSNANNGTDNGSMTAGQQVSSKINGGFDLDGSNDYVGVPYHASLAPTSAISISAWVNYDVFTSGGTDSLISKTANGGYAIGEDTGGLGVQIETSAGSGRAIIPAASIPLSTWLHIYGTYDGTTTRIYLNGQFVTSSTVANGAITYGSNNSLIIGADASAGTTPDAGTYTDGKVDEMRVLDAAQSADWIEAEFKSGSNALNSFSAEETYGATWRYKDNASATDGAVVTSNLLTGSDVSQNYTESNPTALNVNSMTSGQDGEWDFALTNNNASTGNRYFFRLASPDGSSVGSYSNYGVLSYGVQWTQSAFQWYSNVDAVQPTPAYANENTTATVGPNTPLRLRMQVDFSTGLSAASKKFFLQYATATDGPWSYVQSPSAASGIAFYNNPGTNNGATLSGSLLTGTDTVESYVEDNPTVNNPNAVSSNQQAEWDFPINFANASNGSTYYFRMIGSDGLAFETYTQVPSVTYSTDPLLTQSAYRWYSNANNVQPNAALANLNTAASVYDTSPVRLRSQLGAALNPLNASSQAFKLQYSTSTGGGWADVAAPWWNASWSNRRKITFNNSASSENLTDFPIRVSLSAANIDYNKTQNAGQDIRFVDGDGTLLKHEIETWNESGSSEVWVKIPQIDAGSTTDFVYVYYGNASIGDGQDASNVWATGTSAVYHLKEDPTPKSNPNGCDGGTKEVCDSTSNNNDGDSVGSMNSADLVAAKIGSGTDFDGTDDTFQIADSNSLDASSIGISAWAKADTLSGYKTIACKLNIYCLQTNGTNLVWNIFAGGSWREATTSGFTLQTGTWYHFAGVFNTNTNTLVSYINGVPYSSISETNNLSADTNAFHIGRSGSGLYWDGIIDELRVFTTPRSGEWIEAEYVSTNNAMNSFGSEEAPSAWSFYNNSSPASGATIGSTVLSGSNVLGSYIEANPTPVNPNAIAVGNFGEWDWALDPTNAVISTAYYFRVVKADGSALNTYSYYPQIALSPGNTAPNSPTALAQTKTDTTPIPANTLYHFDASTQGWSQGNDTLTNNTTTKRTGDGSLRVATTDGAAFIDDANGTLHDSTSNGPTLSTWVYFPSSNTGTWQASISIQDAGYGYTAGPNVTLLADNWTLVTFTPTPALLASMRAIAITISGAGASGTNYIYVDDIQQGNGIWTSESSVRFSASVSDPDAADTDQLCIEAQPVGTGFTNAEQSCGSLVAQGGTATHTLGSLGNGTQYHWQARTKDAAGLYSSWVAYGGNKDTTTASPDFGIDTSSPTTGSVKDGENQGIDVGYNDGSLTTLSGNWTGFADATSGIARYEYSIGTTAGGTTIAGWTQVPNTTTEVTRSGLTLRTNVTYYFNVRAVDAAGLTSSEVSSNGQQVAPTLTFSVNDTQIDLFSVTNIGLFTDLEAVTISTSTNAYDGYVVRSYAGGPARSISSATIPAFNGGTYGSPDSWQAGDKGLGYTSSDTTIQNVNKFQAATCPGGSAKSGAGCYAPFSTTGPGDIVADHTDALSGAPIVNETFTITYRATTDALQSAGSYQTNITFTCTALY